MKLRDNSFKIYYPYVYFYLKFHNYSLTYDNGKLIDFMFDINLILDAFQDARAEGEKVTIRQFLKSCDYKFKDITLCKKNNWNYEKYCEGIYS